jgi:hypothetical protein
MNCTFRQGLFLGLAIIVIGAAVAISSIGASRQSRPGFTQLWLLPASGTQPENAVRLGVDNKEAATMDYSLVVDMDGKVVKMWPSIKLKSDAKWEDTLILKQGGHVSKTRVGAILYRNDAPGKMYRHVMLWLAP